MNTDPTITQLQSALSTLARTNMTFTSDVVPYDDGGNKQSSVSTKDFASQKVPQVFGFVPVFDQSGKVSFYIRFGGPEVISKNWGPTVDNDSVGNAFHVAYPNTTAFAAKFDKALDQTNHLNYKTKSHAPERLVLQRVTNPDTPPTGSEFGVYASALAQVRSAYPLRMAYNEEATGFDLQYAPMGDEYSNLSNPTTLSVFLVDFITTLLQIALSKTGTTPSAAQTLIQFVKNPVNIQNITKFVFLQRLEDDFKSATRTHLLTEYDGDGPSNGHDAVWVAAFAQMQPQPRSALMPTLASKAFAVAEALRTTIPDASITGATSAVRAYLDAMTTSDNSASSALAAEHAKQLAQKAAEIQAADAKAVEANKALDVEKKRFAEASAGHKAAIESLRRKSEADQSSDRKRERIIGAASAAAVTLWAMQDEELSTLDTLQKGILVGVGALLGGLAPAGFTPVAVLAAPVTTTFVGKQLRKHDISADAARRKLNQRRGGVAPVAADVGDSDVIDAEWSEAPTRALPAPSSTSMSGRPR